MPDASPALTFYRRWVQANAWAEGLGLGATLVLAGYLGERLAAAATASGVLLGAVAAIASGTLLEGTILGLFQVRVLRRYLPRLRPGAWVGATMAGAAAAWTLGMVPSTVMSLAETAEAGPPPSPPEGLLALFLAAGLGLVLGPFLGVPQALLLRRWVAHPWRWVPANMAAWAVGMPLVFLGMGTLPPDPPLLRGILTAFAATFATGLAVGLVHGRVLLGLLAEPREQPA